MQGKITRNACRSAEHVDRFKWKWGEYLVHEEHDFLALCTISAKKRSQRLQNRGKNKLCRRSNLTPSCTRTDALKCIERFVITRNNMECSGKLRGISWSDVRPCTIRVGVVTCHGERNLIAAPNNPLEREYRKILRQFDWRPHAHVGIDTETTPCSAR